MKIYLLPLFFPSTCSFLHPESFSIIQPSIIIHPSAFMAERRSPLLSPFAAPSTACRTPWLPARHGWCCSWAAAVAVAGVGVVVVVAAAVVVVIVSSCHRVIVSRLATPPVVKADCLDCVWFWMVFNGFQKVWHRYERIRQSFHVFIVPVSPKTISFISTFIMQHVSIPFPTYGGFLKWGCT